MENVCLCDYFIASQEGVKMKKRICFGFGIEKEFTYVLTPASNMLLPMEILIVNY